MDRRCRESEGKAKIEGYMSVSDEEAHHRPSAICAGGIVCFPQFVPRSWSQDYTSRVGWWATGIVWGLWTGHTVSLAQVWDW